MGSAFLRFGPNTVLRRGQNNSSSEGDVEIRVFKMSNVKGTSFRIYTTLLPHPAKLAEKSKQSASSPCFFFLENDPSITCLRNPLYAYFLI